MIVIRTFLNAVFRGLFYAGVVIVLAAIAMGLLAILLAAIDGSARAAVVRTRTVTQTPGIIFQPAATPFNQAVMGTMAQESQAQESQAELRRRKDTPAAPEPVDPADGVSEAVRELIAEVASLRVELGELRKVIGRQLPADAAGALPDPDPQFADLTIPAAADAETQWVWSLFAARCASCHSGEAAKGDVELFAEDKATPRTLTAGMLIVIDQAIYSNEMPKAPVEKLTAQEYNRLRAWMQTHTDTIRDAARISDAPR